MSFMFAILTRTGGFHQFGGVLIPVYNHSISRMPYERDEFVLAWCNEVG